MNTRVVLSLLLILLSTVSGFSQSSAFTYQGKLNDGGNPANGQYDLVFRLFGFDTGGSPLATEQIVENVPVSAGLFKVELSFDFPPFTTIAAQWIEVGVRPGASVGSFTTLTPRQRITSSPYAMQSAFSVFSTNATTAATANNALAVGGTPAAQIIKEGDARLTDARVPLPGSASYIQNTTSTQTGSNFNVSGTGRAGTFRAPTFDALGEYQSFGTRVLKVTGDNTALGPNAGDSSFGTFNTYLGSGAGTASTSNGAQNTFAGTNSGNQTTIGTRNSFFGARSGLLNDNGGSNTFVGEGAGVLSTNGSENSFFGADSGQSNSSGSRNSYFGVWSGGLPTVTESTAIGYRAFATQNNTLILGSVNGFNGATSSPNVGIGTVAPTERLHVVGNGLFTGNVNASGNVNGGNISASGSLSGNGSTITSLNAANITTGTLDPARLNNGVILNTTIQQAAANFSIAGSGAVGGVMSANQYNISGNRVLSTDLLDNLFVGGGTGGVNTGAANTFLGQSAGFANTGGGSNSFAGSFAGVSNLTGFNNSFFGRSSGQSNIDGLSNSFFGRSSGFANTTGDGNSFFGMTAGLNNAAGNNNSFFGFNSGSSNTTGSSNTLIGDGTNVGAADLTNATAIGSKALVSQNDSLVLGGINGVNGATADTKVGIGTTSPQYSLHVKGDNLRIEGTTNTVRPKLSLSYGNGGVDGKTWQMEASSGTLRFSTLNDAENTASQWLAVFRAGNLPTQVNFTTADVIVRENLWINLDSSPDRLAVGGSMSLVTLGNAGVTQLCRNVVNQISTCSSSLRYKTNIFGFTSGMDLINRLRPISFDWKNGGMRDVGFGAEDIAKIDSRFVTYNDKGEVEGVKYDRFSVAFVNAFKEQQSQIAELNETNRRLQSQIDALKQLLCLTNREAEICKENK